MTATPPPLPRRDAAPRYTGNAGAIFRLGLVTGLYTFLTLGIYRFWAKTRIRRFIWSATELDGTRFEYTGTGLEKFLGFLVAVVFLAVYLGLIQFVLFFAGLNLFTEAETGSAVAAQSAAALLTFVAVLPFIYFAIYRARRYKLARTRWRAIRFGMEKAAWGYAWRAILLNALTLLSLGLLLPLQTFRLTKYMTDRSWFGTARFRQDGQWTGLYRAMTHLLIALGILVAGGLAAALGAAPAGAVAFPVGAVWLAIGAISYRVQSFAYLSRHTVLDDGRIGFDAHPRTGTVIGKYVIGALAIAAGIGVFTAVLGGMTGVLAGGMLQMSGEAEGTPTAPLVLAIAVAALSYLAVLIVAGAATLALITQPILAHFVATLGVSNLGAVQAVKQREADRGADAEGFADALDIGGAV